MNNPESNVSPRHGEHSLLRTVEHFSLVIAVLLSLGGWYFAGIQMALSVLLGGMLSGGSFFLLKRNIRQIMDIFPASGESSHVVQQGNPTGFAMKFYARLLVLGLLLAVLSMSVKINVIGLLIGLSTVAASVVVVATVYGCRELSGKHVKGV